MERLATFVAVSALAVAAPLQAVHNDGQYPGDKAVWVAAIAGMVAVGFNGGVVLAARANSDLSWID
jgi:hypothetical protein